MSGIVISHVAWRVACVEARRPCEVAGYAGVRYCANRAAREARPSPNVSPPARPTPFAGGCKAYPPSYACTYPEPPAGGDCGHEVWDTQSCDHGSGKQRALRTGWLHATDGAGASTPYTMPVYQLAMQPNPRRNPTPYSAPLRTEPGRPAELPTVYSSSRLLDTGRLQCTAMMQSRSLLHVDSSKLAGSSGLTGQRRGVGRGAHTRVTGRATKPFPQPPLRNFRVERTRCSKRDPVPHL